MKTQYTNFNPKMSSEPIEEKPFLTEDDCGKLWESANAFFGSTGGVNPGAFKLGFEAAAKRANEKISSLESELKALENRYKDLSGALRFKYEECEALREERDQFVRWALEQRRFIDIVEFNKLTIQDLFEQFKAYTLNTDKNT